MGCDGLDELMEAPSVSDDYATVGDEWVALVRETLRWRDDDPEDG